MLIKNLLVAITLIVGSISATVAQAQQNNIEEFILSTDGTKTPFNTETGKMGEEANVSQGYWINVDTRDSKACKQVYESLQGVENRSNVQSLREFCRYSPTEPMVSIFVFQDIDAVEFRRQIDLSALKSTDQNMINDTRNMALTMAGAMGLFWMLPGSVTKWDKEAIKGAEGGIFNEYVKNIKAGPVVDKDSWYFNWIGHPISGAAYYTLARHNNKSMMQSFGYSVVMSTFFWEYGFEAFAEVPSIQDLLITPIIGSLIGEFAYRAELSIRANNNKFLGSKAVGKVALFVLNPMGAISHGINNVIGTKIVQDAEADLVVRRQTHNGVNSDYVGFRVRFLFF